MPTSGRNISTIRRSSCIRRAAAYQAFYEHMPVRPMLSRPDGPVMRVYDRFTFGDLVEISMIDGRQYRSREACYGPPDKGGGHLGDRCQLSGAAAAGRTMIGFAQEAWLYSALAHYQGAMERDRAGRADGAVAGKAGRCRRASGPTTGTATRPIARGCSSASTTPGVESGCRRRRHPFVFRQRPASSISTIRLRRSWRRNSSAPRSRPTGRPTI